MVLVAVALWSAYALDGAQRLAVRGQGLSTLFYGSNWYLILGGEATIGRAGGLSPLFHMWSLAIEEQFYLVWPVIVFFCLRRGHGALRPLVAVAIAISVVSVVLMPLLFTPGNEARAYMGADVRAHQLLIVARVAGTLVAAALSYYLVCRSVTDWWASAWRSSPRHSPYSESRPRS